MSPKLRPNHQQYLDVLPSMTPEQQLLKAFELSEFSRQLFKAGLKERVPKKTENVSKPVTTGITSLRPSFAD